MTGSILYEVDDPVATITLNRPDRLNAWTPDMASELREAIARAGDDRRVVGVIITGAGRAFCAGADLKALSIDALRKHTAPKSPDAEDDAGLAGPFDYLMQLPKPVIAAVNGPAAGMGAVLALWADLRFMADEAMITMSFSQRGTVAESGSSWLLPQLVGPSVALDLLVSSRRVGSEEALRIGLVNRTAPGDQLVSLARDYVVALAESCSPASMATIKRQVYDENFQGLAASARSSLALLGAALDSPDIAEGWQAYLEKRAPQFARLGSQN